MTEDRTPEDRMASFRASSQRAVAALGAVAACAQTALWQVSSLHAGADPERDYERPSQVLCRVRHLGDQFSGFRFHQIRGTADELCMWARTTVPGSSAGTEEPYCDLDINGDATALLSARVSLVIAYADACKQANQHGPATAGSPARIASSSFPSQPLPSPQAETPASPNAASPARVSPRHGPGHRPRRRI